MLGGKCTQRGQRAWVLIPVPSLTSCVTHPGGPSMCPRFPWDNTGFPPCFLRCCEDPKMALGPRTIYTLRGCPCPQQTLLLQVAALSFSLEAKTTTRFHFYVPSAGGTESSWAPHVPAKLQSCSLYHIHMSPHDTHTCNTRAHMCRGPTRPLWTLIQTTHLLQGRPLTSGLSFPPQSPTLTTYQLRLPVSLFFRATSDKGLIF